MPSPLDPTASAFLFAENRHMPMHVAGLQLFETPEGAGEGYVREVFEQMLGYTDTSPLFSKRLTRGVGTAGQWAWTEDEQFDIEHHVRHSALPRPGRIRELLELCSRLHSTRLARERPLWEVHLIEGLADGRVALYTKLHHALVDGIAASRLLQSSMSTDPDVRDMPPYWARKPRRERSGREIERSSDGGGLAGLGDLPAEAIRTALSISADAAGMPAALVKTLAKGARNETSAVSLHAPRTMFNVPITSSRRFAAQGWELDRLKAIGHATGTTLNDVVLAMCSGAVRAYLREHDALPDVPLVAMVPVGLNAKDSQSASDKGGNAVGAVMVQLGTQLEEPEDRLTSVHTSMRDGKEALGTMTPAQIMAMSALGMAPAVLGPMLRLGGLVRPPFNLIISNVPGPRETMYLNGAKLVGSYPVSIPITGMALNITCNSYDQSMEFGLTGCRRAVPSLQRLLTHLDDEVAALEKAVGVA